MSGFETSPVEDGDDGVMAPAGRAALASTDPEWRSRSVSAVESAMATPAGPAAAETVSPDEPRCVRHRSVPVEASSAITVDPEPRVSGAGPPLVVGVV